MHFYYYYYFIIIIIIITQLMMRYMSIAMKQWISGVSM